MYQILQNRMERGKDFGGDKPARLDPLILNSNICATVLPQQQLGQTANYRRPCRLVRTKILCNVRQCVLNALVLLLVQNCHSSLKVSIDWLLVVTNAECPIPSEVAITTNFYRHVAAFIVSKLFSHRLI